VASSLISPTRLLTDLCRHGVLTAFIARTRTAVRTGRARPPVRCGRGRPPRVRPRASRPRPARVRLYLTYSLRHSSLLFRLNTVYTRLGFARKRRERKSQFRALGRPCRLSFPTGRSAWAPTKAHRTRRSRRGGRRIAVPLRGGSRFSFWEPVPLALPGSRLRCTLQRHDGAPRTLVVSPCMSSQRARPRPTMRASTVGARLGGMTCGRP